MKLQESLNAVSVWCEENLMQLNVKKCNVMYFGIRNSQITYTLNGNALTSTLLTRDLGVAMSDDGRASQQCVTVAAKARRISGLMFRTFSSRRIKVILTMYKAIIRPIVEYATPVWSPCQKKDIAEVEQVQRRITKRIKSIQHLTYEARLRLLKLPTLEKRRIYFDLLECYKIVHGLVRSEISKVIALSEHNTRGYRCKLTSSSKTARLNVRKYFFSERVLSIWNALPVEALKHDNYDAFKLAIRKHLDV